MMLETLKSGITNSKQINFYGATLKIRLLSESEITACRLDTIAYAKKHDLDEESQAVENVRRQLFLALSDLDNKPVAENVDKFRELLTRGDREYLVDEYLQFENECLPTTPGMEKIEFEDIMEQVKKSPESIMNSSNIALLRRLIMYLENQRLS